MSKEKKTLLAVIIAGLTSLLEELKEVDDSGGGDGDNGGGDDEVTLKSLKALIATKDEELVAKILSKFGADNLKELDEENYAKAHAKIEALDDAEEEGDGKDKKGKGKKDDDTIDIEALREVAQKLIEAGKSNLVKKTLAKFDAESISKLDEDKYEAVHEKLTALLDD